MRWPFVTRKVHDLELDRLDRECGVLRHLVTEAGVREAYWRGRCERLTDAALSRAGAIHEPTMVERKPDQKSAAAQVIGAMSITEFESVQQ